MVEDAGADIVDINFGCPVRKVTKTGAGANCLDEPDRACAIVDAVANAASLPVSVKMRRGLQNGSRTALEVGPRLVDAGAASLTLHPRSAKQMYTGEADHSLTAELVELVDVPVIASGDITTRARAQTVLATTGAEAVMVGRAAQGNPWALSQIMGEEGEPSREEVVAELDPFHPRDRPRARRAARDRLPEEVLRLVPRPRPVPAALQAGARAARDARRGRAAPVRGRAGSAGSSSSGSKTSCRKATRSSWTSRSRSTAAASGSAPRRGVGLRASTRDRRARSSGCAARRGRRARRSRRPSPRRRARA